ncbi:OsmC family protein [Clostridium sp. DJ247]|uniref:OsmC family protein n=1 Tax=Clostridium sp. DJ247 TaxID=2726188 RepID=UPI001623C78B|nr:OsmC family protein [Clostridium sp. DJ247]MBC2581016.1 OsmC family protein [Clostridium sp. DJ247]
MPITTVKSTTKKIKDKNSVICESRGFNFTLEPTAENDNMNSAMNPMEALLGSLGACVTLITLNHAKNNGINIEDIWVELEGDLDSDGTMSPNIKSGYTDIRCKVHIDTDASQEQISNLMDTVKSKAPVADTIQSGVKLDIVNIKPIKTMI